MSNGVGEREGYVLDNWKKSYILRFKKEQIDENKILDLLKSYCFNFNSLFHEYGVNETVSFKDAELTFPDCIVTFKIDDGKTKINFNKVSKDNPSLVKKDLTLSFNKGYYQIQGSNNNRSFEGITEETIEYVFEKLLEN